MDAADLEAAQSSSWFQGLLRMLARSKGITVKSRRGFFTLGAGLSDEEVLYLYGIVARALSGGEAPP